MFTKPSNSFVLVIMTQSATSRASCVGMKCLTLCVMIKSTFNSLKIHNNPERQDMRLPQYIGVVQVQGPISARMFVVGVYGVVTQPARLAVWRERLNSRSHAKRGNK